MIKITLRLPQWLHDRLKEWAAREERSLNGQIVHLLRQVVTKPGEQPDGDEGSESK